MEVPVPSEATLAAGDGSAVDVSPSAGSRLEAARPLEEDAALRCVVLANDSNSMVGDSLTCCRAVLRFILPRLSQLPTRIVVLGSSSAKRFDARSMASDEAPLTNLGAAFTDWSGQGGMGRVVPHLSKVASAKDVSRDASIIVFTDGVAQRSGEALNSDEWLGTANACLNRMHEGGFVGRIHVLVALGEGPSYEATRGKARIANARETAGPGNRLGRCRGGWGVEGGGVR